MNVIPSTAATGPEPVAAVPADVPQPVPAAIERSFLSTPGTMVSMAANLPPALCVPAAQLARRRAA